MDKSDEPSPIAIEIGKNLQAARNNTGLSLQKVADHMGVARATVGHWEAGRNECRASNLLALAKLYGVTLELLMTGEEPVQWLDPIEQQLLMLFRGSDEQHQEMLVQQANGHYNINNPGPSVSNPYPAASPPAVRHKPKSAKRP